MANQNWSSLRQGLTGSQRKRPNGLTNERPGGRTAPPAPPQGEIRTSPDTLAMGWYLNEEKGCWELALVAQEDRNTHMYIIGANNVGKSFGMASYIRQDIQNKLGFGQLDPHRDAFQATKSWLAYYAEKGLWSPRDIEQQVVILDPTHSSLTATFNPLEDLPGISPEQIALGVVDAFKEIWGDAWGDRMANILRSSFTVLQVAGLTLVELPLLLTNARFRARLLKQVQNPIVLQFFAHFDALNPKTREEWVESSLNKVNALLIDPRMYHILATPQSSFNLRETMDTGRVLLANLDRGHLTSQNSRLLGALLISRCQLAALSRSDIPEPERRRWYLYLDEFSEFVSTSSSFIEILPQIRKFGLSLVLAHQSLDQLPKELVSGVLTNPALQIYYRVNRHDAEILAKEAFQTNGTEVKAVRLSPDRFDDVYYSYQEEWELFIRELQHLPPRTSYVNNKIHGGIIKLRTIDVPSPWQELGFTSEEQWQEHLENNYRFGAPYLRSRDDIQAEANQRVRALLSPETDEEDYLDTSD